MRGDDASGHESEHGCHDRGAGPPRASSVATNVLNPAIIGDMFVSEELGSAMSIVMLAPLLGGAVGPAMSGMIAQSLGWRRLIWFSVFLAAVRGVALATCFRETYKVPILRRRAARLRRETELASIRTVFDIEDRDGSTKIWESVMRPAVVFFGSGVLQALSVFASLVFAYFCIMEHLAPGHPGRHLWAVPGQHRALLSRI